MRCPNCGKDMRCTTGTYHYTESGMDNVYLEGIDICVCECGESLAKIPRIAQLHNILAEMIIEKPNRLTGQEIRFLRKCAGLSAVRLAMMMGGDKSTVSRWESGDQKIGNQYDRLIRLICASFLNGIEVRPVLEEKFPAISKEYTSPDFRLNFPWPGVEATGLFACG